MASPIAKYEDATLRKVLAVTLDPMPSDNVPALHLAALAEELKAEAVGNNAALQLNSDNVERALMARLSQPPAGVTQWPVHYLISVYCRAIDEQRSASALKPEAAAAVRATLGLCRQLAVSYAGLTLMMGLFPQPREAEERGPLQLLDAMLASSSASAAAGLGGSGYSAEAQGGAVPVPQTFLEEFGARFGDEEGLEEVLQPIVAQLMKRASTVSLMGDYQGAINLLARLALVKPLAKALTRLPCWLPQPVGHQVPAHALEHQSLLGPFFGISCTYQKAQGVLGAAQQRQPDVGQMCFGRAVRSNPVSLRSNLQAVGAASKAVQGLLHQLLMLFLKNQDTREAALGWLAAALNANLERCKMQPDPAKSASDGFMVNLAGVLLRVCEPFLDPLSGKAWGKLDPRYTSDPSARMRSASEETRLNAESASQVSAWFKSVGPPPDGKYHFVCECFFMAARALQLGLLPGFDSLEHFEREVAFNEAALQQQTAQLGPDSQQARLMDNMLEWFRLRRHCLAALLEDDSLLGTALDFYRLSSAFLLRLASPDAAAGGPPSLPLPEPPAPAFCMLPEYFLENQGDLLKWVTEHRHELLEARRMEEFMVFFTCFMGARSYVKNAYLRAQMADVLYTCMPRQGSSRDAASRELAVLFEVHPLVVRHIVGSLVQLYIDVELTDRHNAYYEKFNNRYHFGVVLSYLWNLPQHRASWRLLAQQQPSVVVQFIHMLLNDSQILLQNALETLPKVQETERLQADAAAWARLTPEQQAEKLRDMKKYQGELKSYFTLAGMIIQLMQLTADDRDVAACYFDPAVQNRTAKIIDFFLKYLTVPEARKRLKIKDPEQYSWHPKQLITQLAHIHLSLYRARSQEWVQAVAADSDYLGRFPQLFTELLSLLRDLGLLPASDIEELQTMLGEVNRCKASAAQEEEAFEDVPEDFEDPLLGGLMRDPVRLPSGMVVERSSIAQQLLTDPRDPYNRQPCAVEDLHPVPELRARIEAWLREQRSKRMETG